MAAARLLALVAKELLAALRDPRTRAVLLLSPLVQLVLFSLAATHEVRNLPVAVLDRDGGAAAREFAARFEGAPPFAAVLRPADPAEAAALVDARAVAMVVHIGPGFSRDLAAGRPVEVQVVLDGRRSNTAQILLGYAGRIAARFGAEGGATGTGGMAVRIWFNPDLDPLWSTVPATFAVLVAVAGFLVSALSVARERELGTLDQLLVSPLRPTEILLGKAVPAMLVGLAAAAAMLPLAVWILGVPLRGSPALLALGAVVYLAAIVGVGLLISALAASQQQAVVGLFLFMIPAVLLSGAGTPVGNMPEWLQAATQANPIRHFVALCRALFLKDPPAAEALAHVWPLVPIAAATLAAAGWLFRRRVA
ncbi:MAG: ABC transporter permease [Acetobacteraceae bacterium]|nr:ABC transporter permease [Acetobacteraceae bacterium]